MRPFDQRLGASMVLLLVGMIPMRRAMAEPYLAVRTGLRCSQCHINRSGGGGRTDFGSIYTQTMLPMKQGPFRNRALNDFVSLGANFRVLGSSAVSRETPQTAIEISEANFQLSARLVPDLLTLYLDQTVGPNNAAAREVFGLLEQLPLNGYIKAGKFFLPFGLRLADDQEFIRERTGFTYANPDQGVEIGLEPGPLSVLVAMTNGAQGGSENNDAKQITGQASLIFRHFRIGASASRNDASGSRRDAVGAFGGFNLGRLTVLGELDYVADSFNAGPDVAQLVAFVEGVLLLARGINTKIAYGFIDPNTDIGENANIRLRFGVEAFPQPFLQVSGFYTLLQDIPQATSDVDRISIEMHVYY